MGGTLKEDWKEREKMYACWLCSFPGMGNGQLHQLWELWYALALSLKDAYSRSIHASSSTPSGQYFSTAAALMSPLNLHPVPAVPMNPCPCGYYPDANRCRCTETQVRKYISGLPHPLPHRGTALPCLSVLKASIVHRGKFHTQINPVPQDIESGQDHCGSGRRGTDWGGTSDGGILLQAFCGILGELISVR